jgi:4-amino-4-deoxy-L-arabinose transferase-like glycosyltransferase
VYKITQTFVGACLLLILVSGSALFLRLGALPLSGADEPRYARIAEEMLHEGRWVTPILEGRPWLEKPPLYYWITIPFFAILGVSETAARLGPAILALVASLAVLWLGTRLWSSLAGLLAAIILLTSLGFAGYGRAASTDMPMTACLTVFFSVLLAATVKPGFHAWKVWGCYAFLGLAVLAKGPVALVLAIGSGALFWGLDERGGSLRVWRPLAGLTVAAIVSLPWYLLAFRQNAFVASFIVNHNLARYLTDIHHHVQPFYFYIPVLAGFMLPWTGWVLLLWPESWLERLRRWREWDRANLFLLTWLAFPLIFFSFSHSKLAGYILPSLPPIALLLGERLAALLERRALPARRMAAAYFYLIFCALTALAVPFLFERNFEDLRTGILLSTVFAIPAVLAFWSGLHGRWNAAITATLAQGILLFVAVTLLAFPVLGRQLSMRDIARQAAASQEAGEFLVTYRFVDHSFAYYTGYRVAEAFEDGVSLRTFARSHPRLLVGTDNERVPELAAMPGMTVTVLGEQGTARLLRLRWLEAGSAETPRFR